MMRFLIILLSVSLIGLGGCSERQPTQESLIQGFADTVKDGSSTVSVSDEGAALRVKMKERPEYTVKFSAIAIEPNSDDGYSWKGNLTATWFQGGKEMDFFYLPMSINRLAGKQYLLYSDAASKWIHGRDLPLALRRRR